jgi:DNA-binding LacI/PurR family transcriptional regulator
VDNRIGSQNLISHLISDGHKKIGAILGVSKSTKNERFNSYKDTATFYYWDYLYICLTLEVIIQKVV